MLDNVVLIVKESKNKEFKEKILNQSSDAAFIQECINVRNKLAHGSSNVDKGRPNRTRRVAKTK